MKESLEERDLTLEADMCWPVKGASHVFFSEVCGEQNGQVFDG